MSQSYEILTLTMGFLKGCFILGWENFLPQTHGITGFKKAFMVQAMMNWPNMKPWSLHEASGHQTGTKRAVDLWGSGAFGATGRQGTSAGTSCNIWRNRFAPTIIPWKSHHEAVHRCLNRFPHGCFSSRLVKKNWRLVLNMSCKQLFLRVLFWYIPTYHIISYYLSFLWTHKFIITSPLLSMSSTGLIAIKQRKGLAAPPAAPAGAWNGAVSPGGPAGRCQGGARSVPALGHQRHEKWNIWGFLNAFNGIYCILYMINYIWIINIYIYIILYIYMWIYIYRTTYGYTVYDMDISWYHK